MEWGIGAIVRKKGCSTVRRRISSQFRVERCKRKTKREYKVIGGTRSVEREKRDKSRRGVRTRDC